VPDSAGADAIPGVCEALGRGTFRTVVFTSRVGVRSFFGELAKYQLDARSLAGTTVITAGTGTDLALREFGVLADRVPSEVGSAGILEMEVSEGDEVLIVQGTHAPGWLCDALEQRGARTTRLSLHRVEPNPELGRPLPRHDVIYFASPSGVRAWHAVYGEAGFVAEVWSMGEVTGRQLADLGLKGKVVSPYVPGDTHAATATD
jgi:uroporphyrinogen III methyltransferase / synthase